MFCILIDSAPHYCGGYYGPDGIYYAQCNKYLPLANIWITETSLPASRGSAGFASHEARGMVFAGGNSVGGRLDSAYSTADSIFYSAMGELPLEIASGCAAISPDGGHVFFAGGTQNAELFVHLDQINAWASLGNMPGGERYSLGCGSVVNSEGQIEVIMAGGRNSNEPDVTGTEVDIYNFDTGEWRSLRECIKHF